MKGRFSPEVFPSADAAASVGVYKARSASRQLTTDNRRLTTGNCSLIHFLQMAGAEQLGLSFQAPTRKVLRVRELVAAIRTQLERSFTDIYVEGEISNYRPAESGHIYFTLKDGSAQLRVVMWRTQARLLRFRPENGIEVIVRGRVTVYDERGDLQLQAEFLEPKGAGALQIAFEQLKAKLAAEGLFDPERRKPIPALPRRIGLVTSSRGAAVQDILNILRRRHESVAVLIYPAQVQGEGAAAEVAAGVRYFNRQANVDVIIVARGGGSFEDLFAFNDETLARTIAIFEDPDHLRGRPRDRLHHLRFRRRPAGANALRRGRVGHPLQARAGGAALKFAQAAGPGGELQAAAGAQCALATGAACGIRAHAGRPLAGASNEWTTCSFAWRRRTLAT